LRLRRVFLFFLWERHFSILFLNKNDTPIILWKLESGFEFFFISLETGNGGGGRHLYFSYIFTIHLYFFCTLYFCFFAPYIFAILFFSYGPLPVRNLHIFMYFRRSYGQWTLCLVKRFHTDHCPYVFFFSYGQWSV
jgi:hypothetical protein